MTREEAFSTCQQALTKSNVALLELPTGFGKTALSIKLVNWLSSTTYKQSTPTMLLLVAKTVHKQTWRDEFLKWGGIHASVTIECYESLKKYEQSSFDIIVCDEVHHVGSEVRMKLLKSLHYGYIIGLSATIPQKLKQWFRYSYHAQVVSCDIIEAIDSDILPEPEIVLYPLQLENTRLFESIELNPKARGPIVSGEYKDYWKLKKSKQHVIIKCTQKQKLMELNKTIEWYKEKAMHNPAFKQSWLYLCGKRLEFLADCKLPIVQLILLHLKNERTITFCKTIPQTEQLGRNCIHSKNKEAETIYNDFNQGKINHITAVNILNENANLVNCRYGIFCNITSSEIITQQRQGRMLRHKKPVMVIPFYVGTREEELVMKAIEGFNKDKIRIIKNFNEI